MGQVSSENCQIPLPEKRQVSFFQENGSGFPKKLLETLTQPRFGDFLSHFDESETSEDGECMAAVSQFNLMKDFCRDALTTRPGTQPNGKQVVRIKRLYKPSEGNPTGRIFAEGARHSGLALQRLWGKLRAVLTRDFTTDFDMKNCHPTILLSLCRKHFPDEDFWGPLRDYVKNRDAVLTELEENGIGGGKIVVLKSLNCQ